MLEKKLIEKFEEAIKFFDSKDYDYEFIMFEETETIKDEAGNELNGKILPKIWKEETIKENAEKWFYWFKYQAGNAIPEHGKIMITNLSETNKHLGYLQPEDTAFIIEW